MEGAGGSVSVPLRVLPGATSPPGIWDCCCACVSLARASISFTAMFASGDISAGEELTLDYRFVDDPYEHGNVLTEIGLAYGERDYLDPRIKGSLVETPGGETER